MVAVPLLIAPDGNSVLARKADRKKGGLVLADAVTLKEIKEVRPVLPLHDISFAYRAAFTPDSNTLRTGSHTRSRTFAGMSAGTLYGGVVMASQLKSGAPSYGQMYELYVIAAVVVGGASLSGGSGRMFGTLVGAFTIAVIQNGMNLANVNPFTQKIILGLVILAAVLLDRLKQRWWLTTG